MSYPDLAPRLCDGPPCSICGCQDVRILQEPAPRTNKKTWWGSGLARCNHCGAHFHFREAEAEPDNQSDNQVDYQEPAVGHREPAVETRPVAAPTHQQAAMTQQEPACEPPEAPPVDYRTIRKPLCPDCGSAAVRVTHTYRAFRRYKCRQCDARFKLARESAAK